ncbi:MAG: S1 RNA-binding domain-containing protein [bacterium]
MADEDSLIGQILKGEVTNVTKFGAFVKLENTEVGLVHISELSHDYISNIEEYVSLGDDVTVKVVSRNKQGKLELSMKQVKEKENPVTPKAVSSAPKDGNFEYKLSSFMKRAEAKHIDLRRQQKKKQGIVKKQKKR